MNIPLYSMEVVSVFGMAVFSFLAYKDKLPSIESITRFVDLLNSKGGNIIVLIFFSLVGAYATVRMFYYLTQLSVDGKLQQDNAYALMGLAFLTNQLTGAFIGALLKTMTGDTPKQ